jgi:hypothetical protein
MLPTLVFHPPPKLSVHMDADLRVKGDIFLDGESLSTVVTSFMTLRLAGMGDARRTLVLV